MRETVAEMKERIAMLVASNRRLARDREDHRRETVAALRERDALRQRLTAAHSLLDEVQRELTTDVRSARELRRERDDAMSELGEATSALVEIRQQLKMNLEAVHEDAAR